MGSVENRSKLYSILSSLDSGDNKSINRILKDNTDKSTVNAVKKLKKDFIYQKYGKEGLERYLRSVLDYWDDYGSNDYINNPNIKQKHILSRILLSPAKFVAKAYDYILLQNVEDLISRVQKENLY